MAETYQAHVKSVSVRRCRLEDSCQISPDRPCYVLQIKLDKEPPELWSKILIEHSEFNPVTKSKGWVEGKTIARFIGEQFDETVIKWDLKKVLRIIKEMNHVRCTLPGTPRIKETLEPEDPIMLSRLESKLKEIVREGKAGLCTCCDKQPKKP